MKIDPARSRRWHADLAACGAALGGLRLSVLRGDAGRLPAGLSLLLALDALVNRFPSGTPVEEVPRAAVSAPDLGEETPDVVLDLVGGGSCHEVVLSLRCNGLPVDDGALDAVLSRSPATLTLEWRDGDAVRILARWPVAVEDDVSVNRGMVTVLARAKQLAAMALERLAEGRPPAALDLPSADEPPAAGRGAASPLAFAGRALALRVTRRLNRMLGGGPRWFTGLRRETALVDGLPDLSAAPFIRLADDGRRIYADPFLVAHRGETFVFVEDFPFATGKGVISVARVDAEGRAGTPRPVLETDCHVSYPFLLEIDGELHMIPETSARHTVELWRAVSFPDRWELKATLVSGADLSDATLVRLADSWVMLAASRTTWGSSWDALDVNVADDVTGPWRPMGRNPARVDVRSVRPGGAVMRLDGRLVRPVQDCSSSYGGALAFAEIERIDRTGFQERIVRRIDPGHPFDGLHTYNRAAGFEAVDVFGPATSPTFELPAGRRLPTPPRSGAAARASAVSRA